MEDYYEKEEGDPLVFLDVLCVTMISYVRSFCRSAFIMILSAGI